MATAFAPGRVEFLGNHTDYNEGYTLSFATAMGVTIEGESRTDGTVNIESEGIGKDSFSIQSINQNPNNPWSNLIKNVLLQLQQLNAPLGGFDAKITSTLPTGMGFSSGPAVEVALVLFAQKLFNFVMGDMNDPQVKIQIASLCRAAEANNTGTRYGVFDQATALLAQKDHLLLFDHRALTGELIAFHPDLCFVICHTGTKPMLLSSKFNARNSECKEALLMFKINQVPITSLRDATSADIRTHAGLFSPRVFQRAMHVVTENERILAARESILQGNYPTVGNLLNESQASSKEAFENSTDFLDMLINIASTLPGFIGSRLTGGGFAGSTLNLVNRSDAQKFMEDLTSQYRTRSGKEPQAWIVDASDGAA
jgi:galactokinase